MGRLLEEVAARIEIVGDVHRIFAQPSTGSLGIGTHLLTVANKILAAHWADSTLFEHDLDPACSLRSELAVPVSMIVGELITNALKYAHPSGVDGWIRLECHAIHDGVQIRVSDDGVGLPVGFDPASAASLGFRLIQVLASQIGAQVRFEQPGIGLHVTLTVAAYELPEDLNGRTVLAETSAQHGRFASGATVSPAR